MAGDINHVIGATHNEIITIRIARGPVEGVVNLFIFERREIGFNKASVIAPNGAHAARRQRRHDAQHAFLVAANLFAGFFVFEFQLVTV